MTQVEGLDRLSRRDFDRLAGFIQGYSGIKMPPTKMTMVEGRLRRRVRATGHVNLREYCQHLFDKGGLEDEAIHLIDAVTTNKTEFFREPEHFRILAEEVVPKLMEKRPGGSRSPLKVWSAASSIGAEPYTLAMVLADLGERMSRLRSVIFATDICTEVLATARVGIYPEAMMAPIPAEFRRRYVLRSKDRSRQLVRVVPELRAQVHFARVNLMEAPYPVERDLDVVFCRNILIYFDKPTQQMVLERLADHLHPGGYLFLGHSETLAGFNLPLEPTGPTVFRRL
jgi:chemotaxis protein methyltransferase CheR